MTVSYFLHVFERDLMSPDGLSEIDSGMEAVAVGIGSEVGADDPHNVFHGELADFDKVAVGHAQQLPPDF